jgi:hypothetical protein
VNTLAEIKAAVNQLSVEERAELLADLCGWADDHWDRQMKYDAVEGKFAQLNQEAEAAHGAGRTIPLSDLFDRENTEQRD